MLQIDIVSSAPAPAPGQITAWIDLGGTKSLASRATLHKHPAWKDVEARIAQDELSSPYLSATPEQLMALPGAAAKAYPDSEKVKILAARALDAAKDRKAESLVFLLDTPRGADAAADVAEGLELSAYRFEKYKSKPNGAPDVKITLVVPNTQRLKVRPAVESRQKLAESVNRARDLVNEPGSVATPAEIERRARKVAEENELEITVLDAAHLKKEGYEGLLTVGRAGAVPPRMIIMSYKPKGAKADPHICFLGKGVTFDTGGISIKPASKMWEMKGDMSGAAAVIYGMEAIAQAKPKVRVTGIIVTAQNYVDRDAVIPGDIMRAKNGKSIMIDNTDAEGRLILTDGLWRAGEEGVTHLIDIATLTGAIVRALGHTVSGAFGNDAFADRVIKVANDAGEPCWRMPLVDEYADMLKSDIADINNIGSKPEGGAITAALFLREFVPYYQFVFNADGGSGEPVSCIVEGFSGEVALLAIADSDFESDSAQHELQPAIDTSRAEENARTALNALANFSRGKNCRVLRELASHRLIHYPYWVRYFERRRGRFDIRVIDAVTGKTPGAKLKKSLLDAFVAAARTHA